MNDFANKILGTRVNHKILGTSIVFSLTNQYLSFNNSCQDQPAAWLKPKSDFSQLRNQVLRDFFHVNEFSSTNFPCHQMKVPMLVTLIMPLLTYVTIEKKILNHACKIVSNFEIEFEPVNVRANLEPRSIKFIFSSAN